MKVLLRYSSVTSKEPHIAKVILETKAMINIVRANVSPVGGETVLDVSDDKYEEVVELFRSRGVDAVLLPDPILLDEKRCFQCGACVSICPTEVFCFEQDWCVRLEGEKCIQCGVCISACPVTALRLLEGWR